MTFGRVIGAACAVATLLVLAATAQVGNSTLSGTVTFPDGEPANARIYLGMEGKYRQYGVRFRGGRNMGYSIGGLLPGRYELMVIAPGGKPKRIWGTVIGSFDQKTLNVVLKRASGDEELTYEEQGAPIKADQPREWQGGWVEGTILTEKGVPVEGTMNFYRGPTLNATVPVGAAGLSAYYEARNVPPGTWDLVFVPSRTAKLKRARLEKVVLDPDSRTVLGTLRIPAGTLEDAPVTLTMPTRTSTPVPAYLRPARKTSG